MDFSVDRLFCGQTLATFLWTDSYYFLWTDSCYRFVDFSVDRLADLVDRICGQILVINSGQILWTNLCTFVWQILVTDSIDKKHKFGYRNFVDRICRQICTALTNIFSTHLLKRISKIFFSARGRNLFFVGQTLVLFWQTCWKEYRRFSFQQGGEKDRVNPQGKISNF